MLYPDWCSVSRFFYTGRDIHAFPDIASLVTIRKCSTSILLFILLALHHYSHFLPTILNCLIYYNILYSSSILWSDLQGFQSYSTRIKSLHSSYEVMITPFYLAMVGTSTRSRSLWNFLKALGQHSINIVSHYLQRLSATPLSRTRTITRQRQERQERERVL